MVMRQKFPDMRDQNNNFQNTIWVPNQVLPSFSAVETFWNVSLSPWNFARGLMGAVQQERNFSPPITKRRRNVWFGSSLVESIFFHFLPPFPPNFSIVWSAKKIGWRSNVIFKPSLKYGWSPSINLYQSIESDVRAMQFIKAIWGHEKSDKVI